ncbi:MAG TPA: DUF2442 domain-containing protein [Thermoanaerobaculia bacterium]|nr:DUF2442 domain-containing protein [Thermoanaerobaculia bacterium]
MMKHPIYRVTFVEPLGGYRLRIGFDDQSIQEIDLGPVLEGEIYGPLRDPALFAAVSIDPEVYTLVWPNGADFDPATLHDWHEHEAAMRDLAKKWSLAGV